MVAQPVAASHFMQAPHTVQFNIWGMTGGSTYNSQIASDIMFSVDARNPKPLSISLNEVCERQYFELLYVLSQHGYTGMHTYSRGGSSGFKAPDSPDCEWFGNAVFWLGGNGNSPYFGWFSDYPSSRNAARNWACAKALYPSFWSCTAHMEAGNDFYARKQVDEYRSKADALRLTGTATLAAGDFNIDGRLNGTPNASTIASWYTSFFEADNLANDRSSARPTWNTSKYDYIFRANPKSIAHAAYLFLPQHSDHRWVQMYL